MWLSFYNSTLSSAKTQRAGEGHTVMCAFCHGPSFFVRNGPFCFITFTEAGEKNGRRTYTFIMRHSCQSYQNVCGEKRLFFAEPLHDGLTLYRRRKEA